MTAEARSKKSGKDAPKANLDGLCTRLQLLVRIVPGLVMLSDSMPWAGSRRESPGR